MWRVSAAIPANWQPSSLLPTQRVASIDALRGLAILLMAVGNFEMGIDWMPAGLRHAPDIGYTMADLVAPMFITSIAFTVGASMRRRQSLHGSRAALIHLLKRGLALIGIGSIIAIGQSLLYPEPGVAANWGVLQAIGSGTLLLLPFVLLPWWSRLLAGAALLTGYQLLLDRFWLESVLHSSHNGIWGSLSWGGMMLLGTVVADGFAAVKTWGKQLLWLAGGGGVSAAAGLALSQMVPISKNRASASYMLLSLGLCLLLFGFMHYAVQRAPLNTQWLQVVGRNPLALYLANLLILAVFTLPPIAVWHAAAPVWLSLLQAAVIVWANLRIARELDRRGISWRL